MGLETSIALLVSMLYAFEWGMDDNSERPLTQTGLRRHE